MQSTGPSHHTRIVGLPIGHHYLSLMINRSYEHNLPIKMTSQTQATIIIERATKGLQKVSADLQKQLTDLNQMGTVSQELALKIEDQQLELASLQAQYSNARRTADAELKLAILEDADKQLEILLKKFGLVRTTEEAVQSLVARATKAEADVAAGFQEAKDTALAQANAAYRAELNAVNSKHSLESAELKANNAALTKEISFLNEQIKYLQQQLADERATRLAIAQADANKQGVIVNTGK